MKRLTAALALALSVGLLSTACESRLTGPEAASTSDGGPVATQQGPPSNPGIQGLNAVRNTTEKYKDLRKAKADGYRKFSIFVPNMGFHYLQESAINEDGTSDLNRRLNRTDPEILVYGDTEDDPSGDPLVGAEDESFGAVEYAIPKRDGETEPPQHAIAKFNNADADDWHVHPSTHGLPLSDAWTIHGECHYVGGPGVFLAEDPDGNFVLWTPPTGAFGSWSGTVAPNECPSALPGEEGDIPLPPLLIAHGKWWTLHAWIWIDNPDGVFHSTNSKVQH